MDNSRTKHFYMMFAVLAVFALCLLCPFGVKKASAYEPYKVFACTDSGSESARLLQNNMLGNLMTHRVKAFNQEKEESLELMGYLSENNLIGLFTIADWFKDVKVPITSDYVASRVTEFINVRKGPSVEYDIVGKFRKNSYAKILERAGNWTKIKSGNVTGYVYNPYLYMDEEALNYFEENDSFQVVINAGSMNVRTKPNTDCAILGKARRDEVYTWYPERSVDGWYAIQYTDDLVAYVSADYTSTKINLNTALTLKEDEARARAEAYAKALEHSKKSKPPLVNREPMEFTDEELILMSVVVAMEALDEPFEGKVAVANVIINRILDGEWGTTLQDVVYAKGQFSGANSGRIEEYWNKANEDCRKAVVYAASGYNNIDDYLYFISLGKADYSKYYKYFVLGGHCFYARHW